MDLHFSRVRLAPSQAVAAIAPLLQPGADDQRAASTHKLLWSLFARDSDTTRDFLWREVAESGPRKTYYVLSRCEPINGLGLFEVETKPYGLNLDEGDRFAFDLRVNATVNRMDGGKSARHDVVMDALRGIDAGPGRRDVRDKVAKEAGSAWMARKGQASGFELDEMSVESYQTWRLPRGRAKPLSLGVLDLRGTLTVSDPAAFASAVHGGFGKAKAFGLGMMLLRRA
jgi:CRISPR system Cascade subunit CasE